VTSPMDISSTMQDDFPLTITAILEHGTKVFGGSECVTWQGDAAPRRVTYREVGANARRLAAALAKLGIGTGDRVATLCWNSQEHLEAYYGVPCMGAVLHTLNLRLPPAQLAHIVNHAEDKVILVDGSLLPLLAAIAPQLKTVEAYVVIGAGDTSGLGDVPVHSYAELVGAEDDSYVWPELDERAPASMCYTSGTTGDPKGVVYSHRSTYLHALANLGKIVIAPSEADRGLVVVPMFHVNAWGIPYVALFSGMSMVMPGPHMTPDQLCAAIQAEKCTLVSAVPTLWAGILQVADANKVDLSSVRIGTSGGAAIPRSLMQALEQRHGVRIIQGWGMTETSPVGGMAHPPIEAEPGSEEELDWRLKSGRLIAGVQMRIVADDGSELPWDGSAVGEMEVRGPWITGAYHRDPAPEKFHDGWLKTGDIGTIDERGFFQITDRSKDVIKSGGEWISSVELENLLAGSPDVAEVAVIGIPDDKWTERPLACVVPKGDADPATLAAYLDGKVASWQIPENWAFVDEVPKTSVGKFDKKVLRARYADGDFEVIRTKS
jgi:fatty-acyl-CoA synthase